MKSIRNIRQVKSVGKNTWFKIKLKLKVIRILALFKNSLKSEKRLAYALLSVLYRTARTAPLRWGLSDGAKEHLIGLKYLTFTMILNYTFSK